MEPCGSSRGSLTLLVLVPLAVFFAQNSDQSVDIQMLHWQFLQIPLYLVMVGSFLVGILISLLVGGLREIRLRGDLRRLNRQLKQRDGEIAELRALPLRDMDAPDGSDEGYRERRAIRRGGRR